MPDEVRNQLGGNDAAARPTKRALEDDASPVPAKRPRLMDRLADSSRMKSAESFGSQESELELVIPQGGPPESFRVNSRKIGGRQILEKTPVPAASSLSPGSASQSREQGPLPHWSQTPPKHDLGVYSHNMKVDLDFHGRVLERVGLSKDHAYGIRWEDGKGNIKRQTEKGVGVYGAVASPDRRPFVIAADHTDISNGEYRIVPNSKAFVLLGKDDDKPVYAALAEESFSRISALERKFLGFGTTVPERYGPAQKEPNDHRPSFSRNFALLNADEKSELTEMHRELSRRPVGFTALAAKLAGRMKLSADSVSNARLGAPLLLDENEAARLLALGKISVPAQSNLCLLIDISNVPAYARLNIYQAGKLSERELYRLGFEPPWTQGLAPQEKYQLGLLPAGSRALADAVKDETYLTELARRSSRNGQARASEPSGSPEREEMSRSRDRSRDPGR